MKHLILISVLFLVLISCSSKVGLSEKKFPSIALVNKIELNDTTKSWDKIGSGFLLKYRNDTFVVTAKHLLAFAKTDSVKYLTLDFSIKRWTLSPLGKEDEMVVINKLLNENKAENIKSKNRFKNDWLLFSIAENRSSVKPVEFRDSPLVVGEKLYVVGWTRDKTEGEQTVYEFIYHKTKGTHILLKDVIVPEKFGGLSGAPLVDENGLLVGIVSNSTFEWMSLGRLFSPCSVDSLRLFLDEYMSKKSSLFRL